MQSISQLSQAAELEESWGPSVTPDVNSVDAELWGSQKKGPHARVAGEAAEGPRKPIGCLPVCECFVFFNSHCAPPGAFLSTGNPAVAQD